MKNLEKYRKAFEEALEIEEDKVNNDLEYQGIDSWDSVGHMELISELEDAFDIAMETDDIIEFNSYKKGIEILKKYGIEMEI